ncbi:unnamed protein product [Chilo suppressalis]|nr:unnamed protein product [Chilo suppressalis]
MTGKIPHKKYTISSNIEPMTMKKPLNYSFKVAATFSWNSFDNEDMCFHLVNYCDGRLTEKSISPSMNRRYVLFDLPLDTRCTLNITGKYGVTTYIYQTPSCNNISECIDLENMRKADLETVRKADLEKAQEADLENVQKADLEKAQKADLENVRKADLEMQKADLEKVQKADLEDVRKADLENVRKSDLENVRKADLEKVRKADLEKEREEDLEKVRNLTIVASEGATGWDVKVEWVPPVRPALWYNVTLFARHHLKSQQVPGNATSVIIPEVEDSGFYDVAVGAVKANRTAYTSAQAIFPELETASALGTVLGGSWSVLLGLAAVLATLLLLWRRRAAKLKNDYFSEPDDKLPKEWTGAESESGGTSGTTEDSWEVREGRLLLHEVVGEGAFGVVRRATLAPHETQVAVKMLKDFPTVEEIRSFRSEMELMKSVGAHPHIVSLVGCCSGRRPLIVVEYCARGDLLTYLRCSWDVIVSKRNAKYYNNNIESSGYRNDLFKCKPEAEHSKLVVNKMYDLQGICDKELTTRDLLSFCRQIAMGMEFLASNRLVHRDLAARNVLVSADRTLKIADFGLSRDVYQENQYKQKGNGKMPMKWMALESLTHKIYTTQSDVWSFGVVMWEIGSVGASPYAGVAGARLPRLLRAGYRMPRPANCPQHLYELMLWCWKAHPHSRPTFIELHARLDELLNYACADDYLSLEDDTPDHVPAVPARPAHNYVRLLIKSKLGWPRGETYERPLRTVQSNHYTSPHTSLVQPVS